MSLNPETGEFSYPESPSRPISEESPNTAHLSASSENIVTGADSGFDRTHSTYPTQSNSKRFLEGASPIMKMRRKYREMLSQKGEQSPDSRPRSASFGHTAGQPLDSIQRSASFSHTIVPRRRPIQELPPKEVLEMEQADRDEPSIPSSHNSRSPINIRQPMPHPASDPILLGTRYSLSDHHTPVIHPVPQTRINSPGSTESTPYRLATIATKDNFPGRPVKMMALSYPSPVSLENRSEKYHRSHSDSGGSVLSGPNFETGFRDRKSSIDREVIKHAPRLFIPPDPTHIPSPSMELDTEDDPREYSQQPHILEYINARQSSASPPSRPIYSMPLASHISVQKGPIRNQTPQNLSHKHDQYLREKTASEVDHGSKFLPLSKSHPGFSIDTQFSERQHMLRADQGTSISKPHLIAAAPITSQSAVQYSTSLHDTAPRSASFSHAARNLHKPLPRRHAGSRSPPYATHAPMNVQHMPVTLSPGSSSSHSNASHTEISPTGWSGSSEPLHGLGDHDVTSRRSNPHSPIARSIANKTSPQTSPSSGRCSAMDVTSPQVSPGARSMVETVTLYPPHGRLSSNSDRSPVDDMSSSNPYDASDDVTAMDAENPKLVCKTLSGDESALARIAKECAVCGDQAFGRNFGVASCESCKAFFRRNMHKDALFGRCAGGCEVTVASRTHCKRCRLQKCFTVGMKRELIRKQGGVERDFTCSSESVPSTPIPTPTPKEAESVSVFGLFPTNDHEYTEPIEEVESAFAVLDKLTWKTLSHGPPGEISDIEFVNYIEVPTRRIVKISKNLKRFKALKTDDQVALLKGGIMELTWLISALNYDPSQNSWVLEGGDGQTTSRIRLGPESVKGGGDAIHEMFVLNAQWSSSICKLIDGDDTILKMMLVICLFSSDRPSLNCISAIEESQERYATALHYYTRHRHPGKEGIFAKSIQKLVDLRNMSEKHSKMMMTLNVGQMRPLVMEVFDLSLGSYEVKEEPPEQTEIPDP